jgi:hypothetical protein
MCYPNAIDAIKYKVNGTITFTRVMIGFLVLLVWTLACLYICYKLTKYSFRSKIRKTSSEDGEETVPMNYTVCKLSSSIQGEDEEDSNKAKMKLCHIAST